MPKKKAVKTDEVVEEIKKETEETQEKKDITANDISNLLVLSGKLLMKVISMQQDLIMQITERLEKYEDVSDINEKIKQFEDAKEAVNGK